MHIVKKHIIGKCLVKINKSYIVNKCWSANLEINNETFS